MVSVFIYDGTGATGAWYSRTGLALPLGSVLSDRAHLGKDFRPQGLHGEISIAKIIFGDTSPIRPVFRLPQEDQKAQSHVRVDTEKQSQDGCDQEHEY